MSRLNLPVLIAVLVLTLVCVPTLAATGSDLAGKTSYCPGSPWSVHASCSATAELKEPCPIVLEEIRARMDMDVHWMDPHNNGTYRLSHVQEAGGIPVLDGERRTGDEKYTDKIRLTLETSESGCRVHACSESQVFSILDYNTNYCNLHNLYCGSAEGCKPAHTELTLTSEKRGSCRFHDKQACSTTPKLQLDDGTNIPASAPRRTMAEQDDETCPTVTTQSGFDFEKYISERWFVQQQMATTYLPETWNYCVQAKYEKRSSPGFWGWGIQVKNYAQEADATKHDTGDFLCADRADDTDPAKLQVAPCFLPKWPYFTGPYWVLNYNEDEGYALVSGGQPTEWTPDGCRTGTGTNGAGLWVFTRNQARDQQLIDKVRDLAKKQGFDISVLQDVSQENCPALDTSTTQDSGILGRITDSL